MLCVSDSWFLWKMEIIQADFGFFDPKPGDFGGVKLLLQNYLDNKPWDLSGFVDLILEQTTVGTVVKSDGGDDQGDEVNDDEDDLYAVISALNLGRYAVRDLNFDALFVCSLNCLISLWTDLVMELVPGA